MSLAVLEHPVVQRTPDGRAFAGGAFALAACAALLAGWAPLGFSIVTVFLFAGPHNWIEARYFLERLPARWGKLRGFFLLGLGGVLGLTALFAALPALGQAADWDSEKWFLANAAWSSLLVGWILVLVHMRSRQRPCRDWGWTAPVGLAVISLTWIAPAYWSLALVYLHPLIALWILERELRRSRPEWLRAYHACLACVPLLLVGLWWQLAHSAPLPGEDALSVRITRHAGGNLLSGVSTHLLVSTHTFLEMLHYGVWLLAIPLVGLRAAPWRLRCVPLARRSARWRRAVCGGLIGSAVMVLLLWGCFLADYPLTRDVYFTVAMLHVLAEVPFLLRAL